MIASPPDAIPCDYCGLPTPRAWRGTEDGPAFCCYGCRFASKVAASDGKPSESSWMFARLGLAIFCTMNVMAFTMALWSHDVYEGANDLTAVNLSGLFRYLSLFFSLPVLFALGLPLLENAVDSLRRGIASIDVLLIVGVLAAFAVSLWSVLRDEGGVYFEVACMVLVLVTIGRWLEATGRARASRSLDALDKLLPREACVVVSGSERVRPLSEVCVGDVLRVRAGDRVPCDGELIVARANVDEQALTGESLAKTLRQGERVLAGAISLDSDLLLRVDRPADQGAIHRLARLIQTARDSKGRHERLADRAAAWFLPFVAIAASSAGLYHGYQRGPDVGLLTALAVVLIACPCALGIATPLAVWTALAQAARRQVLFQTGESLENLAKVRIVFFDKTGTLTTGSPAVLRSIVAEGSSRRECERLSATLAEASRHVFSAAIFGRLSESNDIAPLAIDPNRPVRTVAGRGLQWDGPNGTVRLGSESWMNEVGLACTPEVSKEVHQAIAEARPVVCLGFDGKLQMVFVLAEELRPEAEEAVRMLHADGLKVHIVTGDSAARAASWGESLGVSVDAGLLPEEKWKIIAECRRQGVGVAMAGDGVNDGPALAASDVGIAMGCGADLSREAAGVCLLDNDLRKIPWAFRLARRTVRIVRQNLFWAFAYNIVGVGLACAGRLNPVFAAVAMTVSSFFVLANSLRLNHDPEAASELDHLTGPPIPTGAPAP